MPKNPRVRKLMAGQHVKGSESCLTLHGSIFMIFFDHSEVKISWKSSVLVVSEIRRLFVNLLTPDEKYYLSEKTGV